jgi:uncharacterized protein (DUF433 family)
MRRLAPGITAQWDVMSGTPCIEGRRIPTSSIAASFASGKSVAWLAEDYRVYEGQIEAAIRYEYIRRRDRKPEFRASNPT